MVLRSIVLGAALSLSPFLWISPKTAVAATPVAAEASQDLKELEAQRKQTADAMSRINRLNPFSPEYGKGPGLPKTGVTELPHDSIAMIEKLLSFPPVQKMMRFAASPELSQAITQLSTSPNRTTLALWEGGFFLFFVVSSLEKVKAKVLSMVQIPHSECLDFDFLSAGNRDPDPLDYLGGWVLALFVEGCSVKSNLPLIRV